MMRKLAVIALFVFCPILRADSILPATASAKPGRLLQLKANTSAKVVKWINYNSDAADLLISETGMSAVFSAIAPGTYKVGAYTATGDIPSDVSECVITVGAAPGPGPGPTPGPTDDLTKSIQAAYAQETGADKASQLAWLAAVYQSSKSLLAKGDKTYGALLTRLTNAIHDPSSGNPTGSLPLVTKVIATYLSAQLGTDPNAAVDAAKVTAAFTAVGGALRATAAKAKAK